MHSKRVSIFLSILFFGFASQAAEKLRVVFFNYPPHVISDGSNKPKGATVDVWEKYLAPKAGVTIEWIGPVPFPRAMQMLENGEADAISLIAKNAEREAKFIFPKTAHIEGQQGLVVKKEEALSSIKTVADIAGKTIGKLGAGYLPPFFEQNKDKLTFEEIPGDDAPLQNVKKILIGRVWAGYFIFADVLLYYAASEKKLADVKVLPFPGSEENQVAYPALSRKLNSDLAKKIEDSFAAIRKSYDYPNLSREYILKAGN